MFLLICFCFVILFLIIKKINRRSQQSILKEVKIDEELARYIAEADFPVLNEKGEFEFVQCETIVFGDERFDELIESSNNPDSW